MYVCTHVRTYVCMHVCTHIHTYVCMCVYVYMYVCMYVCVFLFVSKEIIMEAGDRMNVRVGAKHIST
jgi:hypothetical protein